jgi:hypothetical protein
MVENQMLMLQIPKQINKKLIDTKKDFIKFDSMATCTIVEASAGRIH